MVLQFHVMGVGKGKNILHVDKWASAIPFPGATEFTAEDFQSHKSHWTHPISGHLSNGNYTVHSLPPPSSGSAVINTLGVLDGTSS